MYERLIIFAQNKHEMSPYAANNGIMQTLPIFVAAVCNQNNSARKILEMYLSNYNEGRQS